MMTGLHSFGMLLLALARAVVYPASAAFRSGRGMFLVLSLLHSFSIVAVFWLFAGPGVIVYFICVLLALTLAVRNRNRKAPGIRYAFRIPVVLAPLVILILGISTIALSYKDFKKKEFRAAQRAEGAKLAKLRCGICHSLKGSGVKVGPPLGGIYMRKIGSAASFNYSDAFKNADTIWTEKELDAFLSNVQTYIKGGNMIIQNVEDESERKALIAYLIGRDKAKNKKLRNRNE